MRILPAALLVLLLCGSASSTIAAPRVATPAPPGTAEELSAVVEQARLRFVAKDAAGVLAHLADNYRSGGLTKPDVRQQLLALYSLYEQLRARVQLDHVEMVDGDVVLYDRRGHGPPAARGMGDGAVLAARAGGRATPGPGLARRRLSGLTAGHASFLFLGQRFIVCRRIPNSPR